MQIHKTGKNWVFHEELKFMHKFKIEKTIQELRLMGIFTPAQEANLFDVLKNANIKSENMTLGNLVAFCKLDDEYKKFEENGHNPEKLKLMLQSEIAEQRQFAQDIINN